MFTEAGSSITYLPAETRRCVFVFLFISKGAVGKLLTFLLHLTVAV